MELSNNPYYAEALSFIKDNDLNAMAPGRYVINGDHLYLNLVDSQLRTVQEARLEVHDKYIDIQIPLSKAETFGVTPRVMCTQPDGQMDPERDILFYNDPVNATITVEAGQIVTFTPETAHAPLIGEGSIRKAIFKVETV